MVSYSPPITRDLSVTHVTFVGLFSFDHLGTRTSRRTAPVSHGRLDMTTCTRGYPHKTGTATDCQNHRVKAQTEWFPSGFILTRPLKMRLSMATCINTYTHHCSISIGQPSSTCKQIHARKAGKAIQNPAAHSRTIVPSDSSSTLAPPGRAASASARTARPRSSGLPWHRQPSRQSNGRQRVEPSALSKILARQLLDEQSNAH